MSKVDEIIDRYGLNDIHGVPRPIIDEDLQNDLRFLIQELLNANKNLVTQQKLNRVLNGENDELENRIKMWESHVDNIYVPKIERYREALEEIAEETGTPYADIAQQALKESE